MFLCEVALGKEHNIEVGDGSLSRAPKGYDSIVARGHTEPGNINCSRSSAKFCRVACFRLFIIGGLV